MNTFEVKYQGNLSTIVTHLDSGAKIITDAPKDNNGLGEAFSPLSSPLINLLYLNIKINILTEEIYFRSQINLPIYIQLFYLNF